MTTTEITAALHLCTDNTTSGNPRRVFVGLDAHGHTVKVTDEGYAGRPEWVRELNARGVWEYTVRVPVSEYNRTIKAGKELG